MTRGRLIGAGIVVALLLALGAVFTPTIVVEPDAEAVASSMARSGEGITAGASCRPQGDTFICSRYWATELSESSGQRLSYEVDVNWLGCWDGEPVADNKPAKPIEGCIFIWDL